MNYLSDSELSLGESGRANVNRAALTVVELVVSLAACSLLLALVLPASQSMREASRQRGCLDRLRTIGEAALEYDEVNEQFPPYMARPVELINTGSQEFQYTYSLVQMLEFLGQSKLATEIDPFAFCSENISIQQMGYSNLTEWFLGIDEKRPGIGPIFSGIQIAEFQCPSDVNAPRDKIVGKDQPSQSGSLPFPCLYEGEDFAITNYVANMGTVAVTPPVTAQNFLGAYGAIRTRESDSVDEVGDGASNVILFGESLGFIDELPGFGLIETRHSIAISGVAMGRPDLYGYPELFGTTIFSDSAQYGSAHPDVISVVRCDGSTQNVSRNVHRLYLAGCAAQRTGFRFWTCRITKQLTFFEHVSRQLELRAAKTGRANKGVSPGGFF